MQLRSLALTATLFVMGCASAPPPNQDSPTAGESTASAQATAAPAKPPEAPAASAKPSSAPSAAPSASASASASAKPTDNDHPFSGETLSQADIAKILEKNGALFDECYTLGAGGDKTKAFTATVTVQATLSPTGAVNVVKVLKSTAKDKKVDKCVSTAFKKIQFPAPNKGSGTSVITFPLSFGREEVK